jgi:hypothetical protein
MGGVVNKYVFEYTDDEMAEVRHFCPVICGTDTQCSPPPPPVVQSAAPCVDDEAFIDVFDFPCSGLEAGWTADNCQRQNWEAWHYTKCQLWAVRKHCPITCGLCGDTDLIAEENTKMESICSDPSCGGDDATYHDSGPAHWTCAQWEYADCQRTYRSYSEATMADVREHCPNACAVDRPSVCWNGASPASAPSSAPASESSPAPANDPGSQQAAGECRPACGPSKPASWCNAWTCSGCSWCTSKKQKAILKAANSTTLTPSHKVSPSEIAKMKELVADLAEMSEIVKMRNELKALKDDLAEEKRRKMHMKK